ncbi:DNA breaking-rejoining enzyme [Mycena vulgaris]|nr:DNA breaking-rejoining enzyme [Mycena vulgaris]
MCSPLSCDVIDINGKPVPKDKEVPTYAHAQKMRAAMSYAFGRLQRIGLVPWQEPRTVSGSPTGNPSVSEIVSSYMVSLRRRKVQAGETAVSSRAITEDILRSIYDFNTSDRRSAIQPGGGYVLADSWCGPMTRLMIQAASTISFACLLRFDEALRIQLSDIEFLSDKRGNITIVKLMLRSRKTSQFGGIKPFYLHLLPDHEAHLCPVRALFYWIQASRITSGFLFRSITKFGLISRTNKMMSTTAFLKLFRNNLLDVKVDPAPYGTHSIRRGGVQYLLLSKRVGIRQICEWGGWSTEFTSTSVLRYIISISDDVQLIRQDFLDPHRPPQMKCYVCGRMCHCS